MKNCTHDLIHIALQPPLYQILHPPTKKQWILDLRGVGDRQPFQDIIITILKHEHFSHGTSTFHMARALLTETVFHTHRTTTTALSNPPRSK
jgi:hypothetical protein